LNNVISIKSVQVSAEKSYLFKLLHH